MWQKTWLDCALSSSLCCRALASVAPVMSRHNHIAWASAAHHRGSDAPIPIPPCTCESHDPEPWLTLENQEETCRLLQQPKAHFSPALQQISRLLCWSPCLKHSQSCMNIAEHTPKGPQTLVWKVSVDVSSPTHALHR